mmetsp:Transcript_17853/g.52113  ORF Transcript_17853/g.52113 Transcript_17853/m.52113 type:complete len:232 (-) Transcript_17853:1764-2459(-)
MEEAQGNEEERKAEGPAGKNGEPCVGVVYELHKTLRELVFYVIPRLFWVLGLEDHKGAEEHQRPNPEAEAPDCPPESEDDSKEGQEAGHGEHSSNDCEALDPRHVSYLRGGAIAGLAEVERRAGVVSSADPAPLVAAGASHVRAGVQLLDLASAVRARLKELLFAVLLEGGIGDVLAGAPTVVGTPTSPADGSATLWALEAALPDQSAETRRPDGRFTARGRAPAHPWVFL